MGCDGGRIGSFVGLIFVFGNLLAFCWLFEQKRPVFRQAGRAQKNPEPIDTTCSRFRADSQIRTGDLILTNGIGPLGAALAIVSFHRETPYFSRLPRLKRRGSSCSINRRKKAFFKNCALFVRHKIAIRHLKKKEEVNSFQNHLLQIEAIHCEIPQSLACIASSYTCSQSSTSIPIFAIRSPRDLSY